VVTREFSQAKTSVNSHTDYSQAMGRAKSGAIDAFTGVFGPRRGLSASQLAQIGTDAFGFREEGEFGGSVTSYYLDHDRQAHVLHREDGPAEIIITADGTRIENYYDHGQRHRERSPAQIIVTANGSRLEFYYQHNQLHREDGPAVIEHVVAKEDGDEAESGYFEKYFQNGQLHREDGPALMERRDNGMTLTEYYREGALDREDGPARVLTLNGEAKEERWYRRGELHRDDGGPAVTVVGNSVET
jgi:hypothetical protein